jgi:hypothetical protein
MRMGENGMCGVTEEVTAINEIYEVSANHSNTTVLVAQVLALRNISLFSIETYTGASKKKAGIIKKITKNY